MMLVLLLQLQSQKSLRSVSASVNKLSLTWILRSGQNCESIEVLYGRQCVPPNLFTFDFNVGRWTQFISMHWLNMDCFVNMALSWVSGWPEECLWMPRCLSQFHSLFTLLCSLQRLWSIPSRSKQSSRKQSTWVSPSLLLLSNFYWSQLWIWDLHQIGPWLNAFSGLGCIHDVCRSGRKIRWQDPHHGSCRRTSIKASW